MPYFEEKIRLMTAWTLHQYHGLQERDSTSVRAHVSCEEGLRFESDSSLGLMLAHCPPSSKWVFAGNTGEIKAARKGTGHPNSHADGSV